MVVTIAMFVRGDMSVFQPHLAVADNGIGRAQIHLSFTNRFDFGADQRDTCLHRSLNCVIMVSLPIDGNHFEWLSIRCSFLFDCCWFRHKKNSLDGRISALLYSFSAALPVGIE